MQQSSMQRDSQFNIIDECTSNGDLMKREFIGNIA